MEQIQLDVLLQFTEPQWLSLLKDEERLTPIVLQDGFKELKDQDVQEILEAVLMEKGKDTLIH